MLLAWSLQRLVGFRRTCVVYPWLASRSPQGKIGATLCRSALASADLAVQAGWGVRWPILPVCVHVLAQSLARSVDEYSPACEIARWDATPWIQGCTCVSLPPLSCGERLGFACRPGPPVAQATIPTWARACMGRGVMEWQCGDRTNSCSLTCCAALVQISPAYLWPALPPQDRPPPRHCQSDNRPRQHEWGLRGGWCARGQGRSVSAFRLAWAHGGSERRCGRQAQPTMGEHRGEASWQASWCARICRQTLPMCALDCQRYNGMCMLLARLVAQCASKYFSYFVIVL